MVYLVSLSMLDLLLPAMSHLGACDERINNLPPIVQIDSRAFDPQHVLRQKATPLHFPLSEQDKKDIDLLKKKFKGMLGSGGLAAPQIGISKQIIIFQAPNDEQWKKFRKNLTQYMPVTVWINPSFSPIGLEQQENWGTCFSVKDVAALTRCYQTISYRAYDAEKEEWVEGKATGFLSYLIQHEIGHLNGQLLIDNSLKTISMEDYRRMREAAGKSKDI